MNKEKTTLSISDIARLSGVSIATVSHVINNTGRFSQRTADKVNAVIQEYGYVSNNAARSLKMSTSKTIGLIVPNISNEFFSNIAVTIEQFFDELDYSLFICNTDNDPEKERRYFRRLDKMQVDGLIVISCQRSLDSNLMSRNIPILLLDRKPENEMALPTVSSDAREGIYKATSRLIEKGCRNIVFVSSYLSTYVVSDRSHGYLDAMKDHGLAGNIIQLERGSSLVNTRRQLIDYLDKGNKVDGVVCTSDNQAISAMMGLKEKGLHVPEDVKVFGFDNQIQSAICNPTLSTIERDPIRLGKAASENLLAMMNNEEVPPETVIECSLVERESTG